MITSAADTHNVLDLCDGCGARANIYVLLNSGGELLFCNHHARAHEVELRDLSVYMGELSAVPPLVKSES